MKADIRWLDDPKTFRVNQLPAHSDHSYYKNGVRFSQSLNGDWQFCYSRNAKSRPTEFYESDYDRSGFDTIAVPGHIELAGYDRVHYINTMYPWEGYVFRRPAYSEGNRTSWEDSFSGADYNPVGSYVKEFDLDEDLRGKRVVIRFEGVEQAMYLWLNGQFVGYAEDSFTPSEFDLSPYIRERGNVLAVEVHKRSTAAYLEDQDFFRFFGIFRNVTLFAKPAVHAEDVWVKAELKEDNQTGMLGLAVKLSAEEEALLAAGEMHVMLSDASGNVCLEQILPLADGKAYHALGGTSGRDGLENVQPFTAEMTLPPVEISNVTLWDNHNPYLYDLEITILGSDGQAYETVPLAVGFRRIEIRDKVILLNGKRLIINGVNRHEWNAKSGRCITEEDMAYDIDIFQQNNINAVRTCHYPDQIRWYELCDENGIYVMSETNLESHGSWQKLGSIDPSWNVPGNLPEWREVVVDRARTNFETFKNHPSILFWSLGNESYAGDNIAAMNQYFKEQDDSRLVHYEGVVHNRAYKDCISDVESRMYARPAEIEEYLEDAPQKPFILCEYMHDMGNSLGGMDSYIKLLDKYEMYQGGFIWDYIDQAIEVKDEVTGEPVLRYGGDFDDRPADYEFSGNGIVFADRTEKPALQEVRYYYGLYK